MFISDVCVCLADPASCILVKLVLNLLQLCKIAANHPGGGDILSKCSSLLPLRPHWNDLTGAFKFFYGMLMNFLLKLEQDILKGFFFFFLTMNCDYLFLEPWLTVASQWQVLFMGRRHSLSSFLLDRNVQDSVTIAKLICYKKKKKLLFFKSKI